MRSVGVDLAADTRKTAVATVRWQTGRAIAEGVDIPASDERIVELADRVGPIARSGSGRVVEVYPAAALRVWGLLRHGYKTDASVRADVLESIRERQGWLDLAAVADAMVRTDDAFDAVIAALIARAHAVGKTHAVPPEQRERADREGWIALPSVELEALADAR